METDSHLPQRLPKKPISWVRTEIMKGAFGELAVYNIAEVLTMLPSIGPKRALKICTLHEFDPERPIRELTSEEQSSLDYLLSLGRNSDASEELR